MSATSYIGLTSENIHFDYVQVDVIVPAISSAQPNETDCSKCIIYQDQVEQLMLCVKTEGCGLNSILKILYRSRRCIAFLSPWLLYEKEKGQKDISITHFIGFSTKI